MYFNILIPKNCQANVVFFVSYLAWNGACSRGMSSSSAPPPEQRASELINKLPSSPNLITKTGSAILGSGLIATAISQELYVMNEETVILAGFVVLISFVAKVRSYSASSSRFLLLSSSRYLPCTHSP